MALAAGITWWQMSSAAQTIGTAAVTGTQSGPAYAAGRLIVKYARGVDGRARGAVASAYNWTERRALPLIGGEVVELRGTTVEAALAAAADDPRIEYAEPDYVIHADDIPNDSLFDQQWGMNNQGQTGGTADADIDAPEAWDVGGEKPLVIAIIDTGVDSLHEDLQANIWTNPGEIPGNGVDDDGNGYIDDIHGWDYVWDDNAPMDDNGHGTHVAGIVAAVGNNGRGIAGLNWSARIMALKFLDASGYGFTSDAVTALEYADRMGVKLSNNSWGGQGNSLALREAIDSVGAHGMLFVAAAGNTRANIDALPQYPAAYALDNIITVAATDHNDSLANEETWGSNWGPVGVDLAAPGVEVLSTIPNNKYAKMNGTSMATPHVTGAAALVWSQAPGLSAVQVKLRLLGTVDHLTVLEGKCVSEGRLNAGRAVAGHESEPPDAITDLEVSGTEGSRVTLSWTAVGDDGSTGTATMYELRYATAPIDSANFEAATPVQGVIAPSPSGTVETFTISGLDFGTSYYCAIRVFDKWYNASPVSNEASTTTLGPPVAVIGPASLSDSLQAGERAQHTLHVANEGDGELIFSLAPHYAYGSGDSGAAVLRNGGPVIATAAGDSGTSTGIRHVGDRKFRVSGPKKVLLVYADLGAENLRQVLGSFSDIDTVDTWDASVSGGSIPSVAVLQDYDVVVAWNNLVWADMYAIGDVLADYIDSGGGVVTMVDCWASRQFASYGRYFLEPGYSPFRSLGSANFDSRTLGWYNAGHPLMYGVDSLAIIRYYNQVELTEGAEVVARWNTETPLVAVNPHSVAINMHPGDNRLWLGDYPRLVDNAVRYAAGDWSWVRLSALDVEVAPHRDTTLSLTLDALSLIAGDYKATLKITTNDPALPQFDVPLSLRVTGAPKLAVAPDTVDLDSPFVGYPGYAKLKVSNAGTDLLTVTSITSSSGAVTVSGGPFVIEPRLDTMLNLVFVPEAPGDFQATLTIRSNDPAHPSVAVLMRGNGVEPPVIAVAPDSLAADLMTGQRETDTVTIANVGATDLVVELAVRATAPLATSTYLQRIESDPESAVALNTEAVAGTQDAGFNISAETPSAPTPAVYSPSALRKMSGDVRMLVWGRYADRSAGGEYENTLNAIAAWFANFTMEETDAIDPDSLRGLLRDKHVFLIPEQENAVEGILAIGASWKDVLADFVAAGGTVIVCSEWGRNDGFLTSTGLMTVSAAGQWYRVLVSVKNSKHPLFEGVSGAFTGLDATRWYDVEDPDAEILAVETSTQGAVVAERKIGAGRAILIGFDYYAYGDDMAKIIANAVKQSLSSIPWLAVEPTAFTIPAGSTATAAVTFEATGIVGGEYAAHLVMYSNDPVTPVANIPAYFRLTDVPDVSVLPDTVSIGDVFVGYPESDSFVVANTGPAPLTVSSVQTSRSEFAVSATEFVVPPNEDRTVFVTFTPVIDAGVEGIVTLECDDPDRPTVEIVVRGTGLFPPQVAVSMDTLQADLVSGGTATLPLIIGNDGGSALHYALRRMLVSTDSTWGAGATATPIFVNIFSAERWDTLAPLSRPVAGGAAFALADGKIYYFGGYSLPPDYTVAWLKIYDPATDSWTRGADMPFPNQAMAATAGLDGRLYSLNGNQSIPMCYDPRHDRWTLLTPSPEGRVLYSGAATGPDGKMYVMGGQKSTVTDIVQIYDPVADSWSSGSRMPSPRMQLGAVCGVDGRIYDRRAARKLRAIDRCAGDLRPDDR